jgi:hypothetical protein
MRYNQFRNMLLPFINSRWQWYIFNKESLDVSINIALQQLYNAYQWSFLIHSESITPDEFTGVEGYAYATTDYNIKYPIAMDVEVDDEVIAYERWKLIIEITENRYLANWNRIIVKEPNKCTFYYYRDYSFQNFLENETLDLWIPDWLVPALYYLVLSIIDLIDVQQAEWQVGNNFNKYQYEIEMCKKLEPATLTDIIWTKLA